MSKFAAGGVLYKIQNGWPKLIAYARKRMPAVIQNYSIDELKLCGLTINIAGFTHIYKRFDFDSVTDHLALAHIMRSKMDQLQT